MNLNIRNIQTQQKGQRAAAGGGGRGAPDQLHRRGAPQEVVSVGVYYVALVYVCVYVCRI